MPDEGNLINTLRGAAAGRLDRAFLLSPGGDCITYAEMFDQAGALAVTLADHGVTPGDRVLVQVDKSTDAVALYLACLHRGAVHVPLNPAFTEPELDFFIADATPALVVTEHQRSTDSSAGQPGATIADLAVAAARSTTPAPRPIARDGTELAALLYTSGTTGQPKGAALTHDNLRHNARALHKIWHFTEADHLLHSLPIFHVHGLFVALHCAMLSAIPVTFLPKFDTDAVLETLPQATVFMGVPTHYSRLLADRRFDREQASGIRLFLSGSAPLPDALFDAFNARTGHLICERYGMSEAGIITSNPYVGERIAGTVGFSLPGVELRICDDDGHQLPIGITGNLEIRGPHLFHSYWQQREATEAAHRDQGWFITGDIASRDADGRVTLQGRAGDMIISGGENIYPKEIEALLDQATTIVESAVIGLPHLDLGEATTAVLVVDDHYNPDVIPEALSTLARFKHPKAVVIVHELPRNSMGKVQKSVLRARFVDHYAASD